MSLRKPFVLLTSTLMALAAMTAQAATCSNATLRGDYAFTVHGQILQGPAAGLVDGIAKTNFDGNGGLTQVDAVSHNGTVALVWRPGTGSYTLNADCTGTMTIVNAGSPPLDLAIVVSKSGQAIHTVVLNPGFAITSDAERVGAPKD